MRELKFRAWDGNKIIFRGLHDRNWYTEDNGGKLVKGTHPDDNHFLKIMQFTGLKDKNGVNIFEGDIIETSEKYFIATEFDSPFIVGTKVHTSDSYPMADLKPVLRVVEYRDDLCGFYPFSEPALGGYEWENIKVEDCIVVGNIYQTPELLT